MIGGNLTIGDELSADHKKDVNKAEINPERLKEYLKILKTKGFLSKMKGNKLVFTQTDINEYLRSNLGLIERLDEVDVELIKDQINFKLKVKLFKSSTSTEVFTAAELKRYIFDLNQRKFDFEITEPQDVISNEVVAYLIVGMLTQMLQSLMDTKFELAKVLANREFIDVLCNRISFNLNKSPYLATAFASKVDGVSVFDFVRIINIEILPGELAVYPDLSILA
jgi:hypothetical protein